MAIDADPTLSMDDLDSDEANERALSQLRMVPGGVYEVRREVARGGMGIILEAWDARHGRVVAIKTLRHRDPKWLKRFLREVRLTSELRLPRSVTMKWSPDHSIFVCWRESRPSFTGISVLLPRPNVHADPAGANAVKLGREAWKIRITPGADPSTGLGGLES